MSAPQAGTALVVGLGVSGHAAAQALLRAGERVRVIDDHHTEAVRARAEDLRAAGAEVMIGQPTDLAGLFADVGFVVASPGVRENSPILAAAVAQGLPVWSEPELAWRLSHGRTRLVAVTGTNGKTTTTELVAACLDAPAAGNIGAPLVDLLARRDPPALVVAELSSFQLRFSETLRADVGVLLNLAPDHLDWHGDVERYAAAKARIWANQRPASDWAVVNADDVGARRLLADHRPAGRVWGVTTHAPAAGQVGVADGWIVDHSPNGELVPIVGVADLNARGPHNLSNVCAAAAAALAAGAATAALAEPLAGYRPGAHRLEPVTSVNGVTWINDSKATNPHAAGAALASYQRIIWIAGGRNKGLDFTPLIEVARGRVVAVLTIGEAGPQIAEQAERRGIPTMRAGDLESAIRLAAGRARPGDTVLLAPACASMDQFDDYRERGERFRQLVDELVVRSTMATRVAGGC